MINDIRNDIKKRYDMYETLDRVIFVTPNNEGNYLQRE